MKHLQHLGFAAFAVVLPAGAVLRGAGKPEPDDALVQGARLGVQAYTRASDAYALGFMTPSVALWSLAIAAGVVLLEWLLARPRR